MKIDMTDAAAVLSEHIERIEQLESELARTQAEAAAMRAVLQRMVDGKFGTMFVDEFTDRMRAAIGALNGYAGRAIAERVPLLEAVAKAASEFRDKLTVAPGDKSSDVQRYNTLCSALTALDEKTKGETP